MHQSLKWMLIIYWLLAISDLICLVVIIKTGYDANLLFSLINIIAFQ